MANPTLTVREESSVSRHLVNEWAALLYPDRPEAFFLSPAWQHLCWTHLESAAPRVVSIRDSGERLVGLLPLTLDEPGELRIPGSIDASDALGFLAAPRIERFVAQALVDHLLRDPGWSRIILAYLPPGSPALTALAPMAAASEMATVVELEEVSPAVMLPSSFTAFLEALAPGQRSRLVRKMRSAWRYGAQWHCRRSGAVDPEDIEAFIALMRQSGPEKAALLATPGMESFLREVAAGRAGQAEVHFLVAADGPTACVLQLLSGHRAMFYTGGRRLDAPGSPGIALLCECIRDAIERGFRIYDFLRGEEAYKYDFGAVDVPLHRLTITRRAMHGR